MSSSYGLPSPHSERNEEETRREPQLGNVEEYVNTVTWPTSVATRGLRKEKQNKTAGLDLQPSVLVWP